MQKVDVVIVGAGAAGLMCAITAAQRGRQVLLLDHAKKAGRKILMSGGGRCNFTNLYVEPDNYLSENPHFCKSALARYTQWDFIALVEKHGVAYHEKEAGQLFCDESSKQILSLLLAECAEAGVELVLGCSVGEVQRNEAGFEVHCDRGLIHCEKLVVASGGLSIPKMGATGFGYNLARQFGHDIVPTRAALVPFTLSGRPLEIWADLAGLACEVELNLPQKSFRGALLFTHRGLSGPAVLQISSYWHPGQELLINWLPDADVTAELLELKKQGGGADLSAYLGKRLPRRLAQNLFAQLAESRPLSALRDQDLRDIAQRLHAWAVLPSGTEGYRTAEVTLGGVSTAQVSSSDMQSRLVPGLYFIGECLDVTGHLGGFNFQWAWASAYAAGQTI